jgi:hypothetical protein
MPRLFARVGASGFILQKEQRCFAAGLDSMQFAGCLNPKGAKRETVVN